MYVEAIQFAFHEENMIRTAVRALTLNVYHGQFVVSSVFLYLIKNIMETSQASNVLILISVGDDYVNRFITSPPHAEYFSNLVTFFKKQCINLNELVFETMR